MTRAYRVNRGNLSAKVRKQIFERDAYRCQECGDWHDLQIDHIIPVSRGGDHDPDNLQVLCQRCNQAKYNGSPDDSPVVPFARNAQGLMTSLLLSKEQREYIEARAAHLTREFGIKVTMSAVVREALDLLMRLEPLASEPVKEKAAS